MYHSLGGGLHLLTNATAVPTHHHFVATAPVATNPQLTTATFAHTVEGKHYNTCSELICTFCIYCSSLLHASIL